MHTTNETIEYILNTPETDPGMTDVMDAVKEYMKENRIKYKQVGSDVIYKLSGYRKEYTIRLTIIENKDIEHVYLHTDYDFPIPEDKRLTVAEFIIRINPRFPIGGFEMFIDSGLVRYKSFAVVTGGELTREMINDISSTAIGAMDNSEPGFMAILNGRTAIEAFKIVENEAENMK